MADDGIEREERIVKCPVEDCEKEVLSRAIHLHVLRSAGDGHGQTGEIPDHLDLDPDHLEPAGSREVEVDYPEERREGNVTRLCPYCRIPFRGHRGIQIHLGQVEGRKNHPVNASEIHEPEDFPRVEVDEDGNILAVLDDGPAGSSGQQSMGPTIPVERVYRYIADLYSEGKPEEAARARQRLLDS